MKPFDIQVNGYCGADFCSGDLTIQQCRRACEELASDGVDGILATVITDTIDALCGKLSKLVAFREADPVIARMIAGFHIEGPFLNLNCIGAHPPECVRAANVDDMQRLLDAAQGHTRLVTLAPENDQGLATTRFLSAQGITVSAGHCDPTLEELREAIDAGLSMVTHLGNGCAMNLPRHDNIIQRALSLSDRLWVCYIPDGVHVPFFALKNYLAVSGVDRSIMVTDTIVAAKMGPGVFQLSGGTVEVDERGVARRPGARMLAGSTVTMPQIRENLANHLGLSTEAIGRLIDRNPRQAVGL